MRGIIEGFYGTPWTWDERRSVCAALATAGMDTYVYAPKDDPLHRAEWREPYPTAVLDEFEALAAADTLRVGFSISPGLSMDLDGVSRAGAEDRRALLDKIASVRRVGITLVGLLLDDLDPAPGLGRRHGELTAWLRDELDDAVELFMVPLHYTGLERPPYLEELDATVPAEVPIGWTGRHVVNTTITAADAATWRSNMSGRRPLLWDNTPVNDAVMVDHLFTGPLRGREPALVDELSGYLANPMVQPRVTLPALLSAAAWLRGDDPDAAWHDAAGEHRVFLEGCDGEAPARLADAALAGDPGALTELREWAGAAEHVDTTSLGDAVTPWADRLRAEAAVIRVCADLLAAELDEARRVAPLLLVMWPLKGGGDVQVLGGRGSLRPTMGQDRDSRWIASSESYVAPDSVTDRLVAAVFERLG